MHHLNVLSEFLPSFRQDNKDPRQLTTDPAGPRSGTLLTKKALGNLFCSRLSAVSS
jgi:hypothetical protein